VTDTSMYRVRPDTDHEVLTHISGTTRRRSIRMLPGDRVRPEPSLHDLERGRIVHRDR
jgi:translation initiation factor IF-1